MDSKTHASITYLCDGGAVGIALGRCRLHLATAKLQSARETSHHLILRPIARATSQISQPHVLVNGCEIGLKGSLKKVFLTEN